MRARSETSTAPAFRALPQWIIQILIGFLALCGAALSESTPAHAASGIDIVVSIQHDGQPVSGAKLDIMDSANKQHTVTTDAQGQAQAPLSQQG